MDGKAVRLYQGQLEAVKVYSDDPVEMAKRWAAEGATFLHVVDLNGAVTGSPVNRPSIEAIINAVDVPVQVGGGIRDLNVLSEVIALGVTRAVLGTAIISHPEFVAEACLRYKDKIAAAIDARNGKVAVAGWREGTEFEALEVMDELKVLGVPRVVYTDIMADGAQRGINLGGVKQMAAKSDVPIIISGGVTSLDDIKTLKELEPLGVEGVIVGTALYEGSFTLPDAIAAAS